MKKIFESKITPQDYKYLKSWNILSANLATLTDEELQRLIQLELNSTKPRVMFLKRMNSRLFTLRKKRCWTQIEECLNQK